MVFCVAIAPPLQAQTLDQPRTTFGTIGLIEMPSARMAPDGELSAGAAFFKGTQRYNLNFQALPWLETSLRYSGLRNFEPALPAFYEVYWDRSFAAKARLWREGSYVPEISVGVNDLIGTGVYSSEYAVASKRIGPFDATLGVGWGRLATGDATFKNPFSILSKKFLTRPGLATAGGTDFSTFFRGPRAGLFGGLTWHTPLDGLSFTTEYSSDNYAIETQLGRFKPKSQINYGVNYQVTNSITLGLSWLYGETLGGVISFQTDPTQPQYQGKVAPTDPLAPNIRTPEQQGQAINLLLGNDPPDPSPLLVMVRDLDKDHFVDRLLANDAYSDVEIRGDSLRLTLQGGTAPACAELVDLVQSYGAGVRHIEFETGKAGQPARCDVPPTRAIPSPAALAAAAAQSRAADDAAAIRAIRADAIKQQLGIQAVALNKSEAIVYYVNSRYFAEDDALNRLILILMQDAPVRVEKFRIFAANKEEFDVLRAPMERAFTQLSSAELLGNAITVSRPPMNNPVLRTAERAALPHFEWGFSPQVRQNLFDPNNPLSVQVVAAVNASVELLPGLKLNGEAEATLLQNIPARASDSLLPHVRSDLPFYVHQGGNGIGELHLDYSFRLAPDVYAVARAGYLESMFAGGGGEVLWWPNRQRWALGGDVYEVYQRDFNRLFGLQDYHVTTGHVTLYYQSPWYDINFRVRAGRYLAGDSGVTFEATRRFSTGVEIGGFFTKTNVSAERYGEGSFDKGIIIRIPLGWALPIETQGEFDFDLRPVQRDGGQTLGGDATMYDQLLRTSDGEIDRHVDSFIAP